jgi:hypothetical protein
MLPVVDANSASDMNTNMLVLNNSPVLDIAKVRPNPYLEREPYQTVRQVAMGDIFFLQSSCTRSA